MVLALSLLSVATLGIVVYYVVSTVKAYWRLRHFRGPPLAAWSELWFIRAALSKRCHLILSDVSTEYGPLARIGPNTLLTCDEELYKRVNTPRSGYSRHAWYQAFRFGADEETVFSELDNDKHAHIRRKIAPGYAYRDRVATETDMDALIFSLIDSWKSRYLSRGNINKRMDMAAQIQFLTLDVISVLAFGQSFGYVATNSDLYEYSSTMAANIPIMNFMAAVPILGTISRIPWIARNIAPSVHDRSGMGKIKAVSGEIIARRFAERSNEKGKPAKADMLSSFLDNGLSQLEAADNFLLAILAGSDTTATILKTGFVSMITQPRIIQKLQAECDKAGVPQDNVISYSRSLELPYLQACVKEALRFNPPATGLLPRMTPPQGDHWNGVFIPGGTMIGQCAWNLQRLNFSAYGPDADVFRPERWIEAAAAAQAGDRQRLDRMEKAHDLCFAYGDFKCLGYRLALMELSKVMFELVRRFDIGFQDGMQPLEVNDNYGIFLQQGMWVRVEER